MKRVLILYRHPTGTPMRPAIAAHLHVLEPIAAANGLELVYHNSYEERPPLWLKALEPDAVILHTTYLCMRWSDHFGLFKWRYRWIDELDCPKLAFPQDDYDHSELVDEWLAETGISDLFTALDGARDLLYPKTVARGARVHAALTGYIDDEMARYAATRLRPPGERPLDLVYRASNLPYWFGAHGQLKHRIAEVFLAAGARHGLESDISTRYEDVLYGDAWTHFMLSGRAVIGTESGSSAIDRRGEVKAAFTALLRDEPDLTFEQASARIPPGWDGYPLVVISPRHFEAVVTKTCQVLVEGGYSGVLEAGRHYLSVAADFSNIDEVCEQLRDHALLARLADAAYEDVYLSGRYSYAAFGAQIADVLGLDRPRRTVGRVLTPLLRRYGPRTEDATRRLGASAWQLVRR